MLLNLTHGQRHCMQHKYIQYYPKSYPVFGRFDFIKLYFSFTVSLNKILVY